MTQLTDGSSQLYDGLATLLEKSSELTDGIDQLYDGASQLSDGASELDDGAGQLSDGTVFMNFSSADTDIGRGKYLYAVRLLKEDGSAADTWLGAEKNAEFEIL